MSHTTVNILSFIAWFFAPFLFGYLVGSIPFGLVLTRLAGYGDIRKIGSGNIGATNVLRTGNKGLALATLILDSGKGALAVGVVWLIALNLTNSAPSKFAFEIIRFVALTAGVGAVIGHSFPIWLRFKGGKGVATTLGTLLAVYWPLGLAACGTWLATALVTRISSLSALVAIGLTPLYAWLLIDSYYAFDFAIGTLVIAIVVFIRHKENLQRLMKGQEPKIGAKKKNAA